MTEPASPAPKKFGTLAGVFTPTLLTILGVIMYLRLGWTVGNAGLLGGWLIIALATGITAATGLSLSSIATNTRLEAGGPYAIISKSLGLEVGGSVGVPLYLSQALAVAMYIFGFREGWNWMFPDHPAMLVDLALFAVIFGIAFVSAGLAFKIQYVVIVIIVASLVSIFGSPVMFESTTPITWWGSYPGSPENQFAGADFWIVFAVFFPAATGIMAGANMSGELRNPRRSIPLGTLSAIGLSTIIYFALAFWLARAGSTDELVSNYTIMIDKALWGPIVVAGLLGATFSSALSSLVGAPRILSALGNDDILPAGKWIRKPAADGEPRRAMIVTGGIVLLGILLRDLNLIAPLITMFFLIAYAVINVVMLVETSLGLASFRPTLRLPRVVPLVGTLGCIFAMFIVNPTFSLIAVGVVVGIYFWIMWTGVKRPVADVRSGIFVAFAEWAAAKVIELDMTNVRAWKPNLLVPVQDSATLRGEFKLLVDVCKPEGSIKLLGLATTETVGDLTPRIKALTRQLQNQDVFTTSSVIDSADVPTGILTGLQALGSAFFRPNILFMRLPKDPTGVPHLEQVVGEAERLKVGLILLAMHREAGLGRHKVLNLWLRPPADEMAVADAFDVGNMNLGILVAYRLSRAWHAELNLIACVPDESAIPRTEDFIAELRDLCRIQPTAQTLILKGTLEECIPRAPQSDLDIMGMPPAPFTDFVGRMVEATRSSCVFVRDSGQESALA